jgi:hypothetical protein
MLKKLRCIYILFILFFPSNVFALQPNALFYNIKANLSIASDPIFFIQNVSHKMNMDRQIKWILIKVEYNTPSKSQAERMEPTTGEFNRHFAIKFEVIMPGKNNFYLLTNTVNYATISFTKQKKYALALIPPQIVSRVAPKSFNNTYFNNVILKITFMLDYQTAAIYYYPSTSMNKDTFDNIINNNNTIKIEGGILNRMQSPWSVINYNKYELIQQ